MTDIIEQEDEHRHAGHDRRQSNRRETDRVVAHMPEKEERRHWLVEYGILGLIGIALAGVFSVLWDLKSDIGDTKTSQAEIKQQLSDFIKESDEFHGQIPSGFFTGERFTAMHGKLLTARIEAHEREFVMWKEILKDQSNRMEDLMEAVYLLTGEMRNDHENKRPHN